jgi:hypothetical protein
VPKDSRELDFSRLRAKLREKPRTKIGQVRQAWPEIRALIIAGHSLKDIWTWVNDIGIEIGYARLSHYVGQLKRTEIAEITAMSPPDASAFSGVTDARTMAWRRQAIRQSHAGSLDTENVTSDPLRNLREREEKTVGFNYQADLDIKKLI